MKKKYLYILISLVTLWACDDQWDSHYSKGDQKVDGDNLSIVNEDMLSYLKNSGEFSRQYAFLEKTGIVDQINSKNQGFTLLAYPDSVMSEVTDPNIDSAYFAKTCVCDLPYLPSHLTDGAKMLVWNGKYLKVRVENSVIHFNDALVSRIVKTANGYIYVMDAPIYAPKSLYELLTTLGGNYSLFKSLILSQNTKVFDKNASNPIGVDKTGNTIYDSVFIISNPLFEKLDISNEYISGTMFIPSNDMLKATLNKAYDTQLASLGTEATPADTQKYLDWIWKAMFYDTKYTTENYPADTDIKSVYSNIWRPSVQDVDLSHPLECSNGVAYYVTQLKVPNNQIVWRIKHYFKYWSYCTADEKSEYFKWTNVNPSEVEVKENYNGAGNWSPAPKEWPYHRNDFLYFAKAIDQAQPIALEFQALGLKKQDGKNYPVKALIPPGEYTFTMGFDDGNKKTAYTVKISIIDADGNLIFQGNLKLDKNVNCDRTGGGYPDGYNASTPGYTNASNYDRDGATVGTVTFTGKEVQPMKIRIETVGIQPTDRAFAAHHWCLRPTSNNY